VGALCHDVQCVNKSNVQAQRFPDGCACFCNRVSIYKTKFDGEVFPMKSFVCSLCRNGILGGGLYLDRQSLTYKTNKLTVDQKYRNLILPLQEIKEISWKWMLFPVATVHMNNGEQYKFIIFNKSRFEKWFLEYSR
jgi:hypothetical protein